MENEVPKRGRPRVWENAAAKHRGYRQRQTTCTQATRALIVAVINARLEDPELQARVNAATDDVAVLEALAAYYRERHWQRPGRKV